MHGCRWRWSWPDANGARRGSATACQIAPAVAHSKAPAGFRGALRARRRRGPLPRPRAHVTWRLRIARTGGSKARPIAPARDPQGTSKDSVIDRLHRCEVIPRFSTAEPVKREALHDKAQRWSSSAFQSIEIQRLWIAACAGMTSKNRFFEVPCNFGARLAAQKSCRCIPSAVITLLAISSIEVWVVLSTGMRSALNSDSAAATSLRHCSIVA